MIAADLAALHARCFDIGPRSWSAAEFEGFLNSDLDLVLSNDHALAVIRVVAGEAELLTICVDPACQGAGHGRAMLVRLIAAAQQRGAQAMYLEVAADNVGARAMYHAAGFEVSGQRRGYYARPNGAVDALVLVRDLAAEPTTLRQG